MNIESYSKCSCGAITLEIDGESYSVQSKNLKKFLDIDLRSLKSVKLQDTYCCNHCVNKWGLDLCACGSGEEPDKCKEGYDVCNKSMQEIGEYNHVVANNAFIV